MSRDATPSGSRIALVTGGTSGLGTATVQALAALQWTVVLVGRDHARCESTVARIRSATGNSKVDYVVADLSSRQGVRDAAAQFAARYPALHVLVNNVGALFLNRRESPDGIELTFALNHIAPFLLTSLLTEMIERSGHGRIVNVSSVGHHRGRIRRDDLQWRRRFYRGFQVYHQSKLANLLFTYELARRLVGASLTVNAAGPRLVATNIGADNRWYWKTLKPAIDRVLARRALSPEEGARTIVYLASSPDVERVTGRYFVDEKAVPSSPASYDVETAQWLWRESEMLSGSHP